VDPKKLFEKEKSTVREIITGRKKEMVFYEPLNYFK
jgi:hypothetical protein